MKYVAGYTKYVAGFMFDASLTEVALIRKSKPQWQKGKLNGIGGKVEEDEFPGDAMAREFQEEAGCPTSSEHWKYFATLEGHDFTVYFFAIRGDLSLLKSQEEEKIEIVSLYRIDVLRPDMIENLPWLISVAVDHLTDGRPSFVTATYP